MAKVTWQGAPLLAPIPAALVTSGTMEKPNVATVAWCGIVASDPPKIYISLRKSRLSHEIISESGFFALHLTTSSMVRAVDACGVYSGRKKDKIRAWSLTPEKASKIPCPILKQSPLALECRVDRVIPLGSHDMFLADILAVDVEEDLIDETGKLDLRKTNLMAYAHGDYVQLGKKVGSFGFAVQKKRNAHRG